MEVTHYENFPVASVLLPARLRAPVGVIYHVARGADDIADEGDFTDDARLTKLQAWRAALDATAAGQTAQTEPELFTRLANVVRDFGISLQPFYALVSAFEQDVTVKRYADDAALYDYCHRSANPVGHLMLQLFNAHTPQNIQDADAICTALQLINFWQDVAIDWQKKRIYLPQHDMTHYGVTETDFDDYMSNGPDARFRALLAAKVAQTRALMIRAAPLALRMRGRFGLELCCVVQGGLRILECIEAVNYDVFRQRPVLGMRDWLYVAWRALAMRVLQRVPPQPEIAQS
jgi:squalene synthase HpnC